jgi:hypothetical protein
MEKGRRDRTSSFRDKPKSFSKDRSDRPSRDGEKKPFGFKGKSSFVKSNDKKPSGFTNNPKYFGKKSSENSSNEDKKKSFRFQR